MPTMYHKNIDPQLKCLNLAYPFTKAELDHAFRVKAFESHPDTGGDATEFIKTKNAYDLLTPMCVLASDKDIITQTTIEGNLIFDLGKGLGELINSNDCPECLGKGWYKSFHTTYGSEKICPVCDGRGEVRTTANSFIWWHNWRPCRKCKGLGYLGFTEIKHATLHTCSHCKGIGQIEILNPVLKKGVMQRQKQVKKPKPKKYCECGAILKNGKCWRCDSLINTRGML